MLFALPTSLLCLLLPALTTAQSVSPKRGLSYHGNTRDAARDARVWTTSTDLTWYYNWGPQPTRELEGSSLEFIPMFWGEPRENFRDAITRRQRSGENITHVLGFNEPDMERDVGGSDMSPSDAAELWQDQIEPLKELGIKVGAPAVSGSPIGYAWLREWEEECDGGCNPDFMPIHWYGIFDAFASWVGNMSVTYPDLELWVTEFGLPGASLEETHVFFNSSIDFLDGFPNVTRYAYFGAVRAGSSNIGPGTAMLTNDGELTDVGSWYLGGNATGAEPEGSAAVRILADPSSLLLALFFSVFAFMLTL